MSQRILPAVPKPGASEARVDMVSEFSSIDRYITTSQDDLHVACKMRYGLVQAISKYFAKHSASPQLNNKFFFYLLDSLIYEEPI